jgi:hypothetical protein
MLVARRIGGCVMEHQPVRFVCLKIWCRVVSCRVILLSVFPGASIGSYDSGREGKLFLLTSFAERLRAEVLPTSISRRIPTFTGATKEYGRK